MKAKTLRRFFDLTEQAVREAGDEFEVNQKRLDELKALKFVEAVKSFEPVEEKKSSKKKKGD